jgi:hypothetical protein
MSENTNATETQSEGITESTAVRLTLRRAISLAVLIGATVFSGAGGYFALANTDKATILRVEQIEQKVAAAPTKADLRELRMQVRMDMLNAVWECTKSEPSGSMQCRPRLPRGYGEQ